MAIGGAIHTQSRHLTPGTVHVVASSVLGASGAVGTVLGKNVAVAKTGTGLYTFTVTNGGGIIGVFSASANVTGTDQLNARVSDIALSTGVFTVAITDTDLGGATDPGSGETLSIHLVLQNSPAY